MADNPSEYFMEALGHVLVSMVSMSPRTIKAKDMPEYEG